jgi:hypothetical protein
MSLTAVGWLVLCSFALSNLGPFGKGALGKDAASVQS